MSCPALHFTTLFGIGDPDVNGHKVLRMKGIMMFLVREHNRVAAELVDLHPMWDDEKLFLEVMMMMCLLHPIGDGDLGGTLSAPRLLEVTGVQLSRFPNKPLSGFGERSKE